jgi:hypothetical protein
MTVTAAHSTWPPPATPPVAPASDADVLRGDEMDQLRATLAGRKAIATILRQHFALRDANERITTLTTRLEMKP